MAKILVADDNSNVQKTVALALADLGVDVLAVNNGEAAVRKLPDFSPDLVLADIFMPVRNGYEVCEFVKRDPRFSRVPVVLLVGAFDPLDEREAQRVGADGILKKPFVPPDPLITMVKTLLDRTLGERLVAVSVSKPAVSVQARGGSAAVEVRTAPSEIYEETASGNVASPISTVDFGKADHPIAFSQLLEEALPAEATAPGPGVIEPVEDEQILTNPRDAALGDPIFWASGSQDAGPEGEEPHEEESESALDTRAWRQTEDSVLGQEENEPLQPIEPLEFIAEEPQELGASVVDSNTVTLDPAQQAPLNVEAETAGDLAANPLEWMASAPSSDSDEGPEQVPGWDEPIPDATNTIDLAEGPDTDLHERQQPAFHAEESVPPLASNQRETSSMQSRAGLDEKPSAPPVKPAFESPTPSPAHVPPNLAQQSTIETAHSIPRQDWAELTASLHVGVNESISQASKSTPAPVSQVPPASNATSLAGSSIPAPANAPDAALVEAVVQRVLDKMRPQVVEIITKEFLRPIVQALVHREIEKG